MDGFKCCQGVGAIVLFNGIVIFIFGGGGGV